MRLRPSARLAAILAGSLALGLVVTTGTATAAPVVQKLSNADLPLCPDPPTYEGRCRLLTDGGTADVVDKGADSFLRLTTPGANSHATVYSYALTGQPLSALSTLSYRSLVESTGSNGDKWAPALNIEIVPRPGVAGSTYATLVWEPTYTGATITPGQWQTWVPSATPTGKGGWWSTRADPLETGKPNKWGFLSYTASFADVKAALPDARILSVGVNQGTGSPGLVAGVDQLQVNDTTYDFDNPVAATKVTGSGGGNQSARPLTPFAAPLKATVTGRDGTVPAPGAPVTFTVTAGGNADYPGATFPGGSKTATATADAAGVATSPPLTAGLIPGPVTVTATSGTGSATYPLTVSPPTGSPVADLVVGVAGVPTAPAHGTSFVATVTVRNTSSFPATRVRTAVTAPAGLRITAGPAGLITPTAAVFTAPTLAPGATLTYPVTLAIDAGTRGSKTLTIATSSAVRDPAPLNNVSRPTLTVG